MNTVAKKIFSFPRPLRLGPKEYPQALKHEKLPIAVLTRMVHKDYYPLLIMTAGRSHPLLWRTLKPAQSRFKFLKKTRSELSGTYVSSGVISLGFTFRVGAPLKPLTRTSIVARRGKKRVSWTPSPSPDVEGYRLYWSTKGYLDYDCDFAEVGNVCEIILPDDISSFPLISGKILLGITAVSKSGNESDMQVLSTFVDLVAPHPPSNLKTENL